MTTFTIRTKDLTYNYINSYKVWDIDCDFLECEQLSRDHSNKQLLIVRISDIIYIMEN